MRQFLLALILLTLTACQSGPTTATIHTNRGDIEVELYDSTPGHKENFLRLAGEGYYTGTLFHRVVPGFMVQAGDPDSKGAEAGKVLGRGGPGYELDPEIGAPHLHGALAAARTPNPAKRSSGSQFYVVTGELWDDSQLDNIERIKGITYSDAQRDAYKTIGGRPDLDQDYTVFGEVISGMDVVEAIAEAERDANDRPREDVVIESVSVQ